MFLARAPISFLSIGPGFNLYFACLLDACVHVCRSEDSFRESVPFCSHMVSSYQSQAFGLGGKCLYLMSHLAGPQAVYNTTIIDYLQGKIQDIAFR